MPIFWLVVQWLQCSLCNFLLCWQRSRRTSSCFRFDARDGSGWHRYFSCWHWFTLISCCISCSCFSSGQSFCLLNCFSFRFFFVFNGLFFLFSQLFWPQCYFRNIFYSIAVLKKIWLQNAQNCSELFHKPSQSFIGLFNCWRFYHFLWYNDISLFTFSWYLLLLLLNRWFDID